MSRLPLLGARDPDAPIAWRAGQPLTTRRFLADVAHQAGVLPAHGPVVNLCVDRYRFMVGLGAAMARGHSSLFPPNALPDTLARLREPYGTLWALCDEAAGLDVPAGLPVVASSVAADADAGSAASADPGVPQIDAELQAACLLTSGSTGAPQPHAKRWGTLVRNVGAASSRLAQLLERPDLRGLSIVATVPPQHSYGFESSVLLALLAGAAIDCGRPFYPADIARALAQVPRPRALVTTPFHLKTLLLSGVALPPTELVLSATAPLSPQLAAHAQRSFGGPLIEIYGCTEAGQVATRRTAESELWHAFDGLELHAERGGGEERFVVQGGHVAEATPLSDLLELVDATHFRLLGRANDVIHVAGKRTSLGHLNYHLNCIEGVHDGAFWLPDDVPDAVVRPVAFVVAPDLTAAQVIACLRTRLEAVYLPRRVVHLEALPRESTGKLMQQALRELMGRHGR